MKSILITGCAGFIGSHLTQSILNLGNSIKVIGVDNFDNFYAKDIKQRNLSYFISHPNFEFLELDLVDHAIYSKLPVVDIVVHLAAKAGVRPSIQNPLDYINHNIIVTQNILNWLTINNIKKLVFASSSSVYGNNKKIPFCETDPVDYPISPYAFTKKSCELLCYTYHHLYNINIVNLRFFTVYGPRQRPDLAINKFVSKIIANEPIDIYGDGSSARDYTYYSDIIDGILGAINFVQQQKSIFEIINLGNNSPIVLINLINLIENTIGREVVKNHLPMQEGDVDITYANIEKAKILLGYQPKVSIEKGIKEFIRWKMSNYEL